MSDYPAVGAVGLVGPDGFVVPVDWPSDLRGWLEQVKALPNVVDSKLVEILDEYEGDDVRMQEKYKPANVKPDFWENTKELMLHMNTTRIAVRSLMGVYSGTQTRRVTGKGKYVDVLNRWVNSGEYKGLVREHFRHSVMFGTSCAQCGYDYENEVPSALLMHPVRTRIMPDPANVRRVLVVVEYDQWNRFIRFVGRRARGIMYNGGAAAKREVVLHGTELPVLPVAIAYGENRLASGHVTGRSLVGQTIGYNRILTTAFYALSLLIKWQARSYMVISGGAEGGQEGTQIKTRQINGNTAILVQHGANVSFIKPDAAFSDMLAVIAAYINFLAVSLGMPKSVFVPQDNQSAESARLEGAPLFSTFRGLGNESEGYECDLVLREAGFLHLRHNEVLTMAQLRDLYEPHVQIEPWNYSADPISNAQSIATLVGAGIMRLQKAVKEANPEMTAEEVEAFVADRERKALEQLRVSAESGVATPAAEGFAREVGEEVGKAA